MCVSCECQSCASVTTHFAFFALSLLSTVAPTACRHYTGYCASRLVSNQRQKRVLRGGVYSETCGTACRARAAARSAGSPALCPARPRWRRPARRARPRATRAAATRGGSGAVPGASGDASFGGSSFGVGVESEAPVRMSVKSADLSAWQLGRLAAWPVGFGRNRRGVIRSRRGLEPKRSRHTGPRTQHIIGGASEGPQAGPPPPWATGANLRQGRGDPPPLPPSRQQLNLRGGSGW